MAKMTTEEAFVKVYKCTEYNILWNNRFSFYAHFRFFPKAGITFWDVAHESNGGLIADGYTRSTGKIAMCIAQNGPGITGLVTQLKLHIESHSNAFSYSSSS